MFATHFKIAWRNLRRHTSNNLFNGLGLIIGITVVILLLQFIYFQLSFDQHWPAADRLYSIERTLTRDQQTQAPSLLCAPALAPTLANDVPAVQASARLFRFAQGAYLHDDQVFEEKAGDVAYVDGSFFQIIKLQWLHGSLNEGFSAPSEIAISSSYARKYFGKEDVVGEYLTAADQQDPLRVGAVFADLPTNTQFHFQLLLNLALVDNDPEAPLAAQWGGSVYNTFVLLQENQELISLNSQVNELNSTYRTDLLSTINATEKLQLIPLNSLHFSPPLQGNFKAAIPSSVLWILGILALFILALSYANFTNSALLNALTNLRSIGVRKIIGANRRQIIYQFIADAVVISSVAGFIALVAVQLLESAFQSFLGYELVLDSTDTFQLLGIVILILISGAIFSGLVPGLLFNAVRPAEALKSSGFGQLHFKHRFAKSLVVFQFVVSTILICGALVMSKQLDFLLYSDRGINLEDTFVFRSPSVYNSYEQLSQDWRVFQNQLSQQSGIRSVISISDIPGEESFWRTAFRTRPTEGEGFDLNRLSVSGDFLSNYDVPLLAGRGLRNNFAADSNAVVLNEAAVAGFGFSNPEDALGKTLFGYEEELQIVGVAANFHQLSLRYPIAPLMITYYPDVASFLLVKTNPGQLAQQKDIILSTYAEVFPNNPVDYFNLQSHFDEQYQSELQLGQVLWGLAALAFILGALGLFNLASFMIRQRYKEIGIRKVMGASIVSLNRLLSQDFLILVLLSLILALPLSYWAAQRYLDTFAYRLELPWASFMWGGLIPLGLALFLVIALSSYAASRNPAETLRTE
ncbi:MAG: FtsX-like permease family protein [Bacteroidota bacterium]